MVPVMMRGEDSPPPAASSGADDVSRQQLDAIEKEVQTLRAEAGRLSLQEDSIITLLNQYDLQAQIKTHEIELLDLKRAKTQEQIDQLHGKFSELEKEVQQQKDYLNYRLVQAYKQGQLNYLKLMLKESAANDLLRSYQYITFLAREDNRKLQQYRDSLKSMEQTRFNLEQENRNLALLKQDSEAAHQDLLHSRQEKMKILTAIQDQREMHLDALSDLNAAAGQLQNFFTNGSAISAVPASGPSITAFKGLLPWPVHGRVIQEFGLSKNPRFGTTTMNNGIEIAADEKTDVHAVFGGQVVFSEWFKGYGQSVILSHSDGYYTLYAHNSELLVQRGDSVQRGQVIAKVGSTGALNGPSLYFEFREKDRAVNPYIWLRRTQS